jgi:TPR repeat protein
MPRDPLQDQDFHGHASGHGRIYQQGQGQQFNFEQAYFGTGEGPPPWLLDIQSLPRARELDPLEIGVHRASIEQGSAVPPYVPRDIDDELSRQLAHAAKRGGFVLLVGDSTAGKSRAAYEALLRTLPDYRVVIPDSGRELRQAIIGLFGSPEKCVIWLDDLERYIGSDGLTPGIIGHLRAARVVLLATLRTEQYRKLTHLDREEESKDREYQHQLTLMEHMFNQVDPLVLQRRWSEPEIERTRRAADPRLKDALKHSETYGIAEYLAAGPTLLREWRLAWEAGANPRGAALVSAAIDCVRAGLINPLPLGLLERSHEVYLDAAGGVLLRPEPIQSALAWATKRRYGITSLLLPAAETATYRVFDYLPDAIARDTDAAPIPQSLWRVVLDHAQEEPRELFSIGLAAALQEVVEVAEEAWGYLANAGDNSATYNLIQLLSQQGRFEEIESWCRRSAEAGNPEAATQLGLLLEERGDLEEAENWYRWAAENSDHHGAFHLAALLEKTGRVDEAESRYRELTERPGTAVGHRKGAAAASLGSLLAQTGQFEEAEAWYRRAIDQGDISAAVSLGSLFAETGRLGEAETWWRKAAKAGDEFGDAKKYAMANLGIMFQRQDRVTEAEAWYRKAIDAGAEDVAVPLGIILSDSGRLEEAELLLHGAAEAGVTRGALNLAVLLVRSGKRNEAEPWLRKAIDRGEAGAAGRLAYVLESLGRNEEAEHWYGEAAEEGDARAAVHLGWMLAERGKFEEAERWLRLGGENGDPEDACGLGSFLADRGKDEDAERWLRTAFERGHSHAACHLGDLLGRQNRLEEAEKSFKASFTGGHRHAAGRLAVLLARQNRGREAADWRRRAVPSSQRTSSKGGKATRKGKGKKRRRR